MALPPMPHIVAAQALAELASVDLRYAWDDWNVHPYFRPGDAEVRERALGLSHRARIALTIAIAEWVVHRFDRVSADQLCHDYLEALWAWNIDWRYAIPFRPDDREWQGPIRGPLELALVIANDAFETSEEQGASEAAPAWMSQLARHLLPDPAPFLSWRDAVIARLEQHHPWEYDEDDFFLEHDFRGARVPREIFDLSRAYDPSEAERLLAAFVRRLIGNPNPFLRDRAELELLAEAEGWPYLWPGSLG
ncbi:MAG: hypothetical protein HC927_10450 [Deltaproteobacteria bacterium]|nr:hypothetical protein [Deltaproteobacteria bacterium]